MISLNEYIDKEYNIEESNFMETILIVDNNVQDLQRLVGWIYAECLDVQVLTAKTYEEGSELIKSNHIDLLVLETTLTGDDDELGVRLAEQYREDYPFNTIIFQTIRDDYKYRAELNDLLGTHIYIPKDELTNDRFIRVIEQELARFKIQFINKIFISQKAQKMPIDANAILYLEKVTETKDIKMFIYDREDEEIRTEVLSNMSLEKLLSLPGSGRLFRCHKSYIINKQMILKSVMTEDGGNAFKIRYTDDLVPIGRHFRKASTNALRGISI